MMLRVRASLEAQLTYLGDTFIPHYSSHFALSAKQQTERWEDLEGSLPGKM